jgi:hypothetical protein
MIQIFHIPFIHFQGKDPELIVQGEAKGIIGAILIKQINKLSLP